MGTITGDFAGETVIVTGGSSGIGRAVALAFGDAGATVINADVRREPKDLDADQPTHEAIRDHGGKAECGLDLARERAVFDLAADP